MANEIRLIDANAAIEALAANFRQASADGCDNPFYRVAADTISEMPTVHVDHFPETTKMVPLTEEQLKKKVGNPVFIKSKRRAEWMILWGYNPPEVYGRSFVFIRRTAQKEQFQFSELGVTWNAYSYPPAYIDREAWIAEWVEDGKCDHKPYRIRDDGKWKKYKCSKCGYKAGRRTSQKYCPSCGRATTEDALAELETRLRGERL